MRRGVHPVGWRAAMGSELLRLRGGRRALAIGASAVVATLVATAPVVLLASTLAPGPAEAAAAAVHRGSGAHVGVAVAVGLLVGADHRHGTATLGWLQLGGHGRLAAVAAGQALLAVLLATASASIALLLVASLAGVPLDGIPLALGVHVALTVLWSAWLVCLVTVTRSTLVTIACGVLVPAVLEPAISGSLAMVGAAGVQRLLPGTALRMLGELAAPGDRVVLAAVDPVDPVLLPAVVGCWTLLLAILALRRALRGP
ncbi:hypothetical protein GCM10009846_05120 [Agrococcus versicolor]|uniref:ABC transporter permease n=1 Tax=Agrococcus versicolor TaxID=501482 RepID=A0ABN3AK72_9MICO